MKVKIIRNLLFLLLISSTFAHGYKKVYVGLWSGYLRFIPNTNAPNVTINYTPNLTVDAVIVDLGDTLVWRPEFPGQSGNMTHTITSDQIPVGATTFNYQWNDATPDTLFIYIPTEPGLYKYKCTPHSSFVAQNNMVGAFSVVGVNTCSGGLANHTSCTGIAGCSTCVGIIKNCSCVGIIVPITQTGCSNGLVENTTCTGTINCNTCTGTVKNCSCVGIGSVPPPNNTTTGNGTFANYKTEIEPQIFPNPAEDQLQFTLDPSRKYRIEIYDIQGEMVINEGANRMSEHTLSIKSLKTGKYFAKVYYCACATPKVDCSKAIITLKFIKK